MSRHRRHVVEAWWASLTAAVAATLLTPWGLTALTILAVVAVVAVVAGLMS